MTREEKAAKILAHYGIEAQLEKLKEECREVSLEADAILAGDYSRQRLDALAGELADVQVMILQLREFAGRSQFEFTIDHKLDRTIMRMK